MKLLLDTHVLLWALSDDPRLPSRARSLITNPHNQPFFSVASLWELAIKHQAHPDKLLVDANQVLDWCQQAGFGCLQIAERHVLALSTLRYEEGRPPHNDPFDHIMLCQAKVDGLVLVTRDSLLPNYQEGCVLRV